tara:strand:+ start:1146 stop:1334 length:189 start_codon:yes stop_codon:yes gene_type:complete
MITAILGNVLKALVIDKAQNLMADQVIKAVDDHLDDKQKKILDDAISSDGNHEFNSLKDLLK